MTIVEQCIALHMVDGLSARLYCSISFLGWMSEAFVSDCINTSLSQAKGVTCLPSARALGAPATQHMSGHRKTPVVYVLSFILHFSCMCVCFDNYSK